MYLNDIHTGKPIFNVRIYLFMCRMEIYQYSRNAYCF